MTCPACHGIGQGRNCALCLNATRATFGLPPVIAGPAASLEQVMDAVADMHAADEPLNTPEECEGWARALAYVLGLIFSLCVWMAVICAVRSCT